MSTRYVGVTGIMSRAEVAACLDALPAGLTLMCGVLVSAKTLRGEKNRWHKRYPAVGDIAGIFSDDPRCLNLIHYSSDGPLSADDALRLFGIGGPCLDGFQFNGRWPNPSVLHLLQVESECAHGRRLRFVLQVRQWDGEVAMIGKLRAAGPEVTDVLLDASGGKGKPIDSADIVCARTAIVALREHFPSLGIGIAGGLCADALPPVAAIVRAHQLSIDVEGRLRDGDEGGTLNLDKARAYLKAAGEVML